MPLLFTDKFRIRLVAILAQREFSRKKQGVLFAEGELKK
jgi:hypothetical protein